MAKHQLYKFNDIEMPSPVAFDLELNDIDGDSKRGEGAIMYRIIIASDLRKYSCEWQGLTVDEKNLILKNTSAREGYPFFSCEFDNEYDEVEVSNFYKSSAKVKCTSIANGEKRYSLKMNIVEQGRSEK